MKSYEARMDVFKSYLVDGASFSPVYELPILERTEFQPDRAIPFHTAYSSKQFQTWVHAGQIG